MQDSIAPFQVIPFIDDSIVVKKHYSEIVAEELKKKHDKNDNWLELGRANEKLEMVKGRKMKCVLLYLFDNFINNLFLWDSDC